MKGDLNPVLQAAVSAVFVIIGLGVVLGLMQGTAEGQTISDGKGELNKLVERLNFVCGGVSQESPVYLSLPENTHISINGNELSLVEGNNQIESQTAEDCSSIEREELTVSRRYIIQETDDGVRITS